MDLTDFRVVVEVNLESIAYNIEQIKKVLKPNTQILGIVKADAYGHGSIQVAKLLRQLGINRFAVALLEEGIQLRNEGIQEPILVFGYIPVEQLKIAVDYNITPSIYRYETAVAVSELAIQQNKVIKVHVKIDTGMGRIGFLPNDESVELIQKISKLPNIEIEGIFTHFATSDEEDQSYTQYQLSLFNEFLEKVKRQKIMIPIVHAANSAAIIMGKQYHFDMVRPGIMIYGLHPSSFIEKRGIKLRPAMSLKTAVGHIKELDKGESVSYGRRFTTSKRSMIATIPIGYADGLRRGLTNLGEVLVHGKRVPLVGTICMDQCMIDVSDIADLKIGDEVVIFGKQGEEEITVDEMAQKLGTISYEIITSMSKRNPRVYVDESKIVGYENLLVPKSLNKN